MLLELDFPRGSRNLPQEQITLARKFQIQGYPTVILMDAETNLLGKTGYEYMTPDEYVAHIQKMIPKSDQKSPNWLPKMVQMATKNHLKSMPKILEAVSIPIQIPTCAMQLPDPK